MYVEGWGLGNTPVEEEEEDLPKQAVYKLNHPYPTGIT